MQIVCVPLVNKRQDQATSHKNVARFSHTREKEPHSTPWKWNWLLMFCSHNLVWSFMFESPLGCTANATMSSLGSNSFFWGLWEEEPTPESWKWRLLMDRSRLLLSSPHKPDKYPSSVANTYLMSIPITLISSYVWSTLFYKVAKWAGRVNWVISKNEIVIEK